MKNKKVWAVAGLVAVLGGGWVAAHASSGGDGAAHGPALTAVQAGTVVSTVSATGNVTPSQQLALDFPAVGKLTELDVKPGDRVTAGQVLARIDDRAARDGIAHNTAGVAAATVTVAADQAGLAPAQRAANRAAETQAQVQLDTAKAAVTNAQAVANTDLVTLNDAVSQADTGVENSKATAAQDAITLQAAVDQASAKLTADENQKASDAQLADDRQAVQSARNAQTGGLLKDSQALDKDQQQAQAARDALDAGKAKDDQAVSEAQHSVANAQAALEALTAGDAAKAAVSPTTLATDQSALAAATAALHESQRTLEATTLVAPTDGLVSAVTKRPGELVGGTPPAASGPVGPGPSTPDGFIVLSDTNALPVRAAFSEADAARIAVGQKAMVTFDAIAGRTVGGTVSAVAPTPTVVNNVVTYPVTVIVSQPDGVLPGMTANVAVEVEHADKPLVIPNAAIANVGTYSEVVVVIGGHQAYRQVQLGDQGDTVSEVTAGLHPGEQIVADKPVAHEADGDVIPPPVPTSPLGGGQ